jgi:hypothetical protein
MDVNGGVDSGAASSDILYRGKGALDLEEVADPYRLLRHDDETGHEYLILSENARLNPVITFE